MKKIWLFLGIGLVVIVIGGGIALRAAAKTFIESEEFRSGFTHSLERAFSTVVQNAMVQVKTIRLVGLASVEVKGLSLGSAKRIDTQLGVTRVRANPSLLSLLGTGPIEVKGEGELDGKGRFDFAAKVPKSLFAGDDKPGHKIDTLDVSGNVERVNVVAISSLLFADVPSNPNFQLTRGFLTGPFAFKKPFGGHASAGRKSGDVNMKLENAEWALAVGPVKKLQPPTLDLHIEIKDYTLELRAPVVLSDKVGRATIGGALLLPERADRTMAWDLDVKTEGVVFQGSMAKLFKCKQPPPAAHFTVTGPIAATNCLAAK